MTEVRIYIEGGGNNNNLNKIKMRQGFSQFFKPLRETAARNGVGWSLDACGSRNDAYKDFCTAIKSHPDALNILLVDAENDLLERSQNPDKSIWGHLKARDNWDCPAGMTDRNCFLMVQSMETWIITDRENLKKFYGQGFNEKALPKNVNLENVSKEQVMDALNRATTHTKTKGKYHKTEHGFDLIKSLNPATVRAAAPSCERLFSELTNSIEGNAPPA